MEFVRNIDWNDEIDRFENMTQSAIMSVIEDDEVDKELKNKILEEFDCESIEEFKERDMEITDRLYPMINFGYPIHVSLDDERIIEARLHTNTVLMYDTKEDEYYIALTGGGMDMSQDIALAYAMLGASMRLELLFNVSLQRGLSINESDFDWLVKKMRDEAQHYKNMIDGKLKEIEETIKEVDE